MKSQPGWLGIWLRVEVIEKPLNPGAVRTDQNTRLMVSPLGARQRAGGGIQRGLSLPKQNVFTVETFDDLARRPKRLRLGTRGQRLGGGFQTGYDIHREWDEGYVADIHSGPGLSRFRRWV